MKPVRFIRSWQQYSVGDVITPMAAFGETLVKSGKAEYVEDIKVTVGLDGKPIIDSVKKATADGKLTIKKKNKKKRKKAKRK